MLVTGLLHGPWFPHLHGGRIVWRKWEDLDPELLGIIWALIFFVFGTGHSGECLCNDYHCFEGKESLGQAKHCPRSLISFMICDTSLRGLLLILCHVDSRIGLSRTLPEIIQERMKWYISNESSCFYRRVMKCPATGLGDQVSFDLLTLNQ